MKLISYVLMSALFSSTAFTKSEYALFGPWKGFSDPEIFSSGFTNELSSLPLEGGMSLGPKGWSGDYWASKKGGINFRWNAKEKVGFGYKSPSKLQVLSMSSEDLAALAPTEKFDIFMGRYDYPLKKEASSTASKRAKEWAGICHGWAPASIFHNEPTFKTVSNPDGVKVPFGSADIKALLSYFYAFYLESNTDQIGLRCFYGKWMGGYRSCDQDLNAGAFHIVIANKLGIEKQGFMIDVDRFNEVWNQPLVGYKSKIIDFNLSPSSGAATSAVKEIRIETEIFYIDETDPTWDVNFGTKNQLIETKKMIYRLELNSEGKIVGGEWESEYRPDFIWNKSPAKVDDFFGLLKDLPLLLND